MSLSLTLYKFIYCIVYTKNALMRTCLNDNRGDFSSYGNLDISVATAQYREKLWVYESVVGFVNATVRLIVKLMTMAACWSMAILIAPLGLIYLYFYHSRSE